MLTKSLAKHLTRHCIKKVEIIGKDMIIRKRGINEQGEAVAGSSICTGFRLTTSLYSGYISPSVE